MEAIQQMQTAIDQVQTSSKVLEKLNKQAQTLADKADKAATKYAELVSERECVEAAIGELKAERAALMNDYIQAQFEGEQSELRRITARRKELDAELQQCEDDITRLNAEASGIPTYEQDAVKLAVELDRLTIPNPYALADAIKRELIKATQDLGTRKQTARNSLPAYDAETYDAVLREVDQDYAKRKTHQEQQAERTRQMLEAKNEAAKYERQAVNNGDGYIIGWRVLDRDTGALVRYEGIAEHDPEEVRAWSEDRDKMRRLATVG